MDEDAGQSSDEDQLSSSCDIDCICVEELSQTARHVTRQVQCFHYTCITDCLHPSQKELITGGIKLLAASRRL